MQQIVLRQLYLSGGRTSLGGVLHSPVLPFCSIIAIA